MENLHEYTMPDSIWVLKKYDEGDVSALISKEVKEKLVGIDRRYAAEPYEFGQFDSPARQFNSEKQEKRRFMIKRLLEDPDFSPHSVQLNTLFLVSNHKKLGNIFNDVVSDLPQSYWDEYPSFPSGDFDAWLECQTLLDVLVLPLGNAMDISPLDRSLRLWCFRKAKAIRQNDIKSGRTDALNRSSTSNTPNHLSVKRSVDTLNNTGHRHGNHLEPHYDMSDHDERPNKQIKTTVEPQSPYLPPPDVKRFHSAAFGHPHGTSSFQSYRNNAGSRHSETPSRSSPMAHRIKPDSKKDEKPQVLQYRFKVTILNGKKTIFTAKVSDLMPSDVEMKFMEELRRIVDHKFLDKIRAALKLDDLTNVDGSIVRIVDGERILDEWMVNGRVVCSIGDMAFNLVKEKYGDIVDVPTNHVFEVELVIKEKNPGITPKPASISLPPTGQSNPPSSGHIAGNQPSLHEKSQNLGNNSAMKDGPSNFGGASEENDNTNDHASQNFKCRKTGSPNEQNPNASNLESSSTQLALVPNNGTASDYGFIGEVCNSIDCTNWKIEDHSIENIVKELNLHTINSKIYFKAFLENEMLLNTLERLVKHKRKLLRKCITIDDINHDIKQLKLDISKEVYLKIAKNKEQVLMAVIKKKTKDRKTKDNSKWSRFEDCPQEIVDQILNHLSKNEVLAFLLSEQKVQTKILKYLNFTVELDGSVADIESLIQLIHSLKKDPTLGDGIDKLILSDSNSSATSSTNIAITFDDSPSGMKVVRTDRNFQTNYDRCVAKDASLYTPYTRLYLADKALLSCLPKLRHLEIVSETGGRELFQYLASMCMDHRPDPRDPEYVNLSGLESFTLLTDASIHEINYALLFENVENVTFIHQNSVHRRSMDVRIENGSRYSPAILNGTPSIANGCQYSPAILNGTSKDRHLKLVYRDAVWGTNGPFLPLEFHLTANISKLDIEFYGGNIDSTTFQQFVDHLNLHCSGTLVHLSIIMFDNVRSFRNTNWLQKLRLKRFQKLKSVTISPDFLLSTGLLSGQNSKLMNLEMGLSGSKSEIDKQNIEKSLAVETLDAFKQDFECESLFVHPYSSVSLGKSCLNVLQTLYPEFDMGQMQTVPKIFSTSGRSNRQSIHTLLPPSLEHFTIVKGVYPDHQFLNEVLEAKSNGFFENLTKVTFSCFIPPIGDLGGRCNKLGIEYEYVGWKGAYYVKK